MNRIPLDARTSVIETIQLPKSTPAQKRSLLTKKNLLRTTIDEIELLSEVCMYSTSFPSVLLTRFYS